MTTSRRGFLGQCLSACVIGVALAYGKLPDIPSNATFKSLDHELTKAIAKWQNEYFARLFTDHNPLFTKLLEVKNA